MLKNIVILTLNDLAIAVKNKTLLLVLFIPIFVFVSLNLLDKPTTQTSKVNIALVKSEAYMPVILNNIKAAEKLFAITWTENKELATQLLKEHKVDGVITSNQESDGLELLVLKQESIHTIALVQSFTALQKAAEGNRAGWISRVNALHHAGVQKETLPTWILMIILLVGFIILPTQVAEEKEKKLLLGLLQTPMLETQWLAAKLITGIILIVSATLLLHLLSNIWPEHLFSYIAFIVVGSFCFSAYGIFLGFLCRTQASARTLGVIFYLPHLLPSAMSDVSQKLTAVAPLLPSYQLYQPLQFILLEDHNIAGMAYDWSYLLLLGLVMLCLSYWLVKKRWLM